MSGSVVSLVVSLAFAVWLCLFREAQAGSYAMKHPQKMFCDADYVFKFRAMPMAEASSNGRVKRLVPGGGMPYQMKAKRQMVEVERIYKGEKMMMPMMKLTRGTESPVDAFTAAATKIEAMIQLGMYQKEFKKNEKSIFFGRNSTSNTMMADPTNTIRESSLTKTINRGLRRKYGKGCNAGCNVRTVYWDDNTKSREYCYWNAIAFRPPMIDCRKITQFCYRGKDGYCQWKATKEYKKCTQKNKAREP